MSCDVAQKTNRRFGAGFGPEAASVMDGMVSLASKVADAAESPTAKDWKGSADEVPHLFSATAGGVDQQVGMGQNYRGPQAFVTLVHVFICQGSIWVPIFDPTAKSSCASFLGTGAKWVLPTVEIEFASASVSDGCHYPQVGRPAAFQWLQMQGNRPGWKWLRGSGFLT